MTLGGVPDMATYLREANDHIITLAMIETQTALQNFEAIIGTPGIDGFFLGPSDLSIALSDGKTVDPLSKEVDAHLDAMIAGAQKAKKIPGAYCHSAERAAALAKRGREISRRIERPHDAARRRGGRTQDAQGVSRSGMAYALPGNIRASVRSRQTHLELKQFKFSRWFCRFAQGGCHIRAQRRSQAPTTCSHAADNA